MDARLATKKRVLAELLGHLRQGEAEELKVKYRAKKPDAPQSAPQPSTPEPEAPAADPTPDELAAALSAFGGEG